MKIVFFQNNIEYMVTVDNENKTIELTKIVRREIGKPNKASKYDHSKISLREHMTIITDKHVIEYQTIIKIPIKEPITIWNAKVSKYWLPKLKKLIIFS